MQIERFQWADGMIQKADYISWQLLTAYLTLAAYSARREGCSCGPNPQAHFIHTDEVWSSDNEWGIRTHLSYISRYRYSDAQHGLQYTSMHRPSTTARVNPSVGIIPRRINHFLNVPPWSIIQMVLEDCQVIYTQQTIKTPPDKIYALCDLQIPPWTHVSEALIAGSMGARHTRLHPGKMSQRVSRCRYLAVVSGTKWDWLILLDLNKNAPDPCW